MNTKGPIGYEQYEAKIVPPHIPIISYTEKDTYELDRLCVLCLSLKKLSLPFSKSLLEKIDSISDLWQEYIIEKINTSHLENQIGFKFNSLGEMKPLIDLSIINDHIIFQTLKSLGDKEALDLFLIMYRESLITKANI